MKKRSILLLLLPAALLQAAPDAYPIIEVSAGRLGDRVYTSPHGESVFSEEAASIPGVRLERQGTASPQADLRIRGGAFSSSGFALEGLPLFNPQTEHFHADLPLQSLLVESPRLLTGPEQFRVMSGHASGTVEADFAEPDNHVKADLAGGSDGYLGAGASAGYSQAVAGGTLGGTAFLQHDRMDETDGQPDNDLDRWTGGALLQRNNPDQSLRASLLAARSWRRFGARGFYGAPASLASEEEVDSTLLLGSVRDMSETSPFRVTAAWQETDDRYWLDRHNRDLYENHTRSEVGSLHADGVRRLTGEWSAALRGDYNRESVVGRYSGTIPSSGLGNHDRQKAALGAMPEWSRGPWTLSAGGAGEWFDTDKPAWLPAAEAAFRPAAHQELFAGITTAVRQPSYTELNYESPGSLGNQDLQRQETVRAEAGWRYDGTRSRAGALAFVDRSKEVVDWVKTNDTARWTAVNLDPVTTRGAILYGGRALGDRLSVNGEYMALDKNTSEDVHASRYALDYAPNEVRVGLQADPVANWRVGLWETAAFYAHNPARHGPDTQLESNLDVRYQVPARGLTFSAGIANLWDREFETLPGQPSAGRQCYCGLSLLL